ncbi:MAG: translocation/assembly module TamB domain-containing protein [Halioglobus sp.]
MSKALKFTLAGLSLLFILTVAALLGAWALISSESGSNFLVGQLRESMGDSIQWETMQGPLTGPLELTNVSVSEPGTEINVGKAILDWQPSALLKGELSLNLLAVDNINIALDTDESSASTDPFSPASLRPPIDISLSEVRISNVHISQGTEPPLVIDSLLLKAELKGGLLNIRQLDLQAPQGTINLSGTASLEDDMPLDLHANWTLSRQESAPLKGETGLKGTIIWSDTIGFALAYDLGLQGLAQLEAGLPDTEFIAGEITGRFLGDVIELEQISLRAENHDIELALQGAISGLQGEAPSLDTQLQWRGLHWPLDTDKPDFISDTGKLQLKGPLEGYQLALATSLEGTDIPAGHWQAQGRGNLQQFTLESMSTSILEGELTATGIVSWDPTPAWQLRIEGDQLNPGLISTELEGIVATALDTSGKVDSELGVLAQFEIERLNGEILGYPLAATAAGEIVGESVKLAQLDISSGQNQLMTKGQLSASTVNLNWELRALSPGEFAAGVTGAITGTGTISGTAELPQVTARIKGKTLAIDSFSTPELDITLAAGTAPGDTLKLEIDTGPLSSEGETLADALTLKANGTNAEHELQLTIFAEDQSLSSRLHGGVTAALDGWEGSLKTLEAVTTPLGAWSLTKPAPLSIGTETASLGKGCLSREGGPGQACVEGNWHSSEGSDFALLLQQIPLELLQTTATGDLKGNLRANLAADGSLQTVGKFEVSSGLIIVDLENGKKRLNHEGGTLSLKVDQNGAVAELHFVPPENGTLSAQLKLPALTRIPLDEQQPLSGRLQAALPDLSSIAAWVPDIQSATGQMNADLKIAGTLDQPRITGKLELHNGSAEIPMAGLKLQQAELQITGEPTQPDLLQVSGGVTSGPGEITLSGVINTAQNSAALRLKGDHFEAYNTRDARVSLSPDLQIDWVQETLKLRGDVLIPEAEITPKLELSPAMISQDGEEVSTPDQIIAPSADVVIVNGTLDTGTADELSAPFRIDNQTRLVLGDAVNVKAVGFIGRITGDVLFTNTPEQTELIPIAKGQFSVEDGTFRSFGQDLDIRTGQLLFNNVPATEPEINLRAVRWIDNDPQVSSAGITLTGPVTTPTMELFSRPQLEASEVQAYLLTGRSTGDRNNVLSIGTYVSPRIYVGYGYNTLEKTSEFNSIFNITPRYGAGINVGEADNNLNMTFTYER